MSGDGVDEKKKTGFARLSPEEHRAVSARGGKTTAEVYGFHLMPREKHLEIAKAGGHAAARSGKAYRFDSESGRAAGRRGGAMRARKQVVEGASAGQEVSS